MKPKQRKALFIKALCDTYGKNTEITRQQIIDVWSKNPDLYTHHLPMEKALRIDRGLYKTPRQYDNPDDMIAPKPKNRTIKQVVDALSIDSFDTTDYNEYVNEDEDIDQILRML